MEKLFLYSDQIIQENRRIDERLISALPKGQSSKIGYIPATGDPDKTSSGNKFLITNNME
ncbi:hypothetical protein [Peribacillus alkalitolerans]|uniref:hypothetical protein n=1 Tax=Peribacillus alkalitolerans TaxID=1550385 RepID=UPI0013D694B0|nr:hypothetical protein [Peribacillus alkalitolerans]